MSDIPHENREYEQRQKQIEDAIGTLRGAFSGLIIMGTWELEDGQTATVSASDGNWHAQNGMMAFWHRKRMASADLDAADQHTPPEESV